MEQRYSPFDVVNLRRSDRAARLYSDLTAPIDNVGWSVVYGNSDWLLLYRDGLLIRIPTIDVRLVAKYSINGVLEHLRSTSGYGQDQETGRKDRHLGSEEGDPNFDLSGRTNDAPPSE